MERKQQLFAACFITVLSLGSGSNSDDLVEDAAKPKYSPALRYPASPFLFPQNLYAQFLNPYYHLNHAFAPHTLSRSAAATEAEARPYGLGAPESYARTGGSGVNEAFGRVVNNGLLFTPEDNKAGLQVAKVPSNYLYPEVPQANTNVTLCYYLGDDIINSHLQYNPDWAFTSTNPQGISTYLNELTFETNKLLGRSNFLLKWKGPAARATSSTGLSEQQLSSDTLKTAQSQCDVVVFMVFNDFSQAGNAEGHKYSGFTRGGPCENHQGRGYAVVVDQGYHKSSWTGPQIMAHHLLRMLTSDLCNQDSTGIQGWSQTCFCPNESSLLYYDLKPGTQFADKCVLDKLNLSNVSLRRCLRND